MSELPSWDGIERIGLDTETHDESIGKKLGPGTRRGAEIVGISFAIEGARSYYLPFGHLQGGNMEGDVLGYVRDNAKNFKGTVVTANGPYDFDMLEEQNVVFSQATLRDIQIGAPLINENHFRYGMDAIAERYGIPGKDETLLKQAAEMYGFKKNSNGEVKKSELKGRLWQMHSKFVGPYGEYDAELPLKIQRLIEVDIASNNLQQIYQIESDLMPVVIAMQRRGVRIDQDRLEQIRLWSIKEERAALKKIRLATGVNIHLEDINNKSAVAPALEAIGVKLKKTEKTDQPQIDQKLLMSIDHHVAKDLMRAKKLDKLRNTFVSSVIRHMTNGRIHCTYNQLRRAKEEDNNDGLDRGARYGRMSSENPNLQQQPSRDEFAAFWRSIYVPDHPGQLWAAIDYSQQEPRILTHYAELCGFDRAEEAAEKYRNDPNTDNHQMMADLCGLPRKAAKAIFLGLCYGMGSGKLARSLGLPTKTITLRDGVTKRVVAGEEAQEILDRFRSRAPYVHQLSEYCQRVAKQKGTIITLLGRVLHFEQMPDGQFDWTYKALNKLIQGSAGDQTKLAMVLIHKAGLPLQIQVHDEVGASIDNIQQARDMAEIMMNCVPQLKVPSQVDIEIGRSWGESGSDGKLGGFTLKVAA